MVERSAGLWAVTFLILGLFVAVAVISPTTIPDIDAPGGDGGGTGKIIDFKAPILRASVGEMEEGEASKVRVSSQPERAFLEEGGSWVWTFSLIGKELGLDDATLRYGDGSYVGWMSVPGSGVITGYGPRFMQGPSSATSPAEVEFDLTIFASGSFTLRAWIMDQKAMSEAGLPVPTSPLARSADLIAPLTVKEPEDPWVKVEQGLSGPSGVQKRNSTVDVKLTDEVDRGDTEWEGTVVDYIAIERDGIRASDVSGRVTSSPRSTIVWEEDGDRLVGRVKSTSPFSGRIDQTEWSIDIELRFAIGGTYKITTWAADGVEGDVVSGISSIDIRVELPEPEPEPEPVPDPDDNSTNSSALPPLLRAVSPSAMTPAPPDDVAAAVRE
jgi:hypothetical protein